MTQPANLQLPAGNPSHPSGGESTGDLVAEWPLKFTGHNFDASCYSTYDCNVRYGNYRRIDDDGQLKLSSASVAR